AYRAEVADRDAGALGRDGTQADAEGLIGLDLGVGRGVHRDGLLLPSGAAEVQGAAGRRVVAVAELGRAITGAVGHVDPALDGVGQGNGEHQVAALGDRLVADGEGGAVVVGDGAGGGAAYRAEV